MLVMFALIILLLIIIGFLLIRRQLSNPLTGAEVLTAEYTDDTGVSCTRAYIEVNKSSLVQVSEKQFHKFADSIAKKDEYTIFTIVCEDGTGVVFSIGDELSVNYGYIDSNGRITETFGSIIEQNGTYVYHAH